MQSQQQALLSHLTSSSKINTLNSLRVISQDASTRKLNSPSKPLRDKLNHPAHHNNQSSNEIQLRCNTDQSLEKARTHQSVHNFNQDDAELKQIQPKPQDK